MPNWVDNYMTILVPRDRADAFKAAVQGPMMWPYPIVDANGGGLNARELASLSNHETLEIDGNAEALIAAFRETPAGKLRPDWMPVSRMDVIAMRIAPERLEIKTVPLSIPALAPWKDRAEFDHFFPGLQEGPYWNIDPAYQRSLDSGGRGSIALCNQRLGVKWPLLEMQLIEEDTRKDGLVDLRIRYQTPWSPAQVVEPMQEVLKAHGAKMLVIWSEEDCNSGFLHSDPARDVHESDDCGHTFEHSYDDEDGDEFREVNLDGLGEHALSIIEDDDFEAPIF